MKILTKVGVIAGTFTAGLAVGFVAQTIVRKKAKEAYQRMYKQRDEIIEALKNKEENEIKELNKSIERLTKDIEEKDEEIEELTKDIEELEEEINRRKGFLK